MDKNFKSFADMDSVTVVCPCGESISGEGDRIAKFREKHLSHTDGAIEHGITKDGMRAFLSPDK